MGVKPEKPKYVPETESITRPTFNNLRKRIDTQMSEQEMKSLLPSEEPKQPQDPGAAESSMLQSMIVCESEITEIQKKVQKHIDDVEQLAKSNAEEKQNLKVLVNQYNEKQSKQE